MSETSYPVMFHPVLATWSDSNDDEVVLFTNRPLAGSPGNPHLRLPDAAADNVPADVCVVWMF